MFAEKPIPYNPEEREKVAQLFRRADGVMHNDMMRTIVPELVRTYGRVNYADLESICREYRLQTAFLALPWTEEMSQANPNKMVIDPNDPQRELTWEALACETLANVAYYASMYGVDDYEPQINFIRLENAGMTIFKPQK